MKIKFLGAARQVTGSKHLIILDDGRQILLDCGLYQAKGEYAYPINRHWGLKPDELSAVILSHIHIDHSGNLPKLVKDGYYGPIYCTEPTKDLSTIMLMDSAHIQENDTEYYNKKQIEKQLATFEPLYTQEDILPCITLFKNISYSTEVEILKDVFLTFVNAGHILGSAITHLRIKENEHWKTIVFTGDLGRYNNLLLPDPAHFKQADYIICESTYGNRLHENTVSSKEDLLRIITETCVQKQGKLIIPAFSLGRSQELIYTMEQLYNEGRMPDVPIYLDSPLSVNLTNVSRNNAAFFNDNFKQFLSTDPEPFTFKSLKFIQKATESKMLNTTKKPCIIISASGMIEAGRIKHHVRNSIENPNNTILLAGYCEASTLGGRLLAGAKQVSIFRIKYKVKASIYKLTSFSAHGDYHDMIKILSCQDKQQVKTIFLVHGEYEVQQQFKEKLLKEGYKNVEIPDREDVFDC